VHAVALRTPDAHPLQGGYRVVACGACGAGFADVAMRQEFYDRYYATEAKYAEDHRPTASPDEEPDLPAWVRRRFSDIAARMTAQVPHRGRTLDIGCANGTLLDALRTSGWSDLHGVDPSPRSAAIARAKGIAVEVGTFGHLPSWAAPFGCICLTGVLEHVWDVDQAMRDIDALLGPDGVVYIEVPDAARYLDPFIAPFEDFNSEHVNHFSESTLAALARRRGFETVWSTAMEEDVAEGVPAAVVAVAWRRARRSTAGPARVTRDVALVESLVSFTRRSSASWAVMEAALGDDLAGATEYAVWGMGEFTLKLMASPVLAGRKPVALIDVNPARHGQRFGALSVTGPEQAKPIDAPIVIGSLLRADSIAASVERRGWRGPILRPRLA